MIVLFRSWCHLFAYTIKVTASNRRQGDESGGRAADITGSLMQSRAALCNVVRLRMRERQLPGSRKALHTRHMPHQCTFQRLVIEIDGNTLDRSFCG